MIDGADSLVRTAHAAGVDICFANPGTSELPVVAALDRLPALRTVLCAFEGVCTAAADGWARMTGRPAATLLHLGPGLANGLAYLHDARRARTPVVNWVGDQATDHLRYDAPLTSDIAALARTVGWVHSVTTPAETAAASRAAVAAALEPPGRVATLILPSDCLWLPGPEPLPGALVRTRPLAPAAAIAVAAQALRAGAGLLLGADALGVRGQQAAARIQAATGARVWVETFVTRQECGAGLPAFPSVPYFPEQARAALAGVPALVLAGARDPVGFFGYPDQPSRQAPPEAAIHVLADPDLGEDATAALEALADELGARPFSVPPHAPIAFEPRDAPLDADLLGRTLAALAPEGAIVVNEAITSGMHWRAACAAQSRPFTLIGQTGGAIGEGLPLALGVALACPGRRVIAFEADGSALYTPQALWSMAREGLDVTVLLCANRAYRILQAELRRAGHAPGAASRSLTALDRPAVDWVALARGFGLPGERVHTAAELGAALARSFAEPGPRLVEAVLAG